ncbi:hypothetical protein QFC21_003324 [Naganishia friedmannii]|uniref:Uncharacterized protein n=1 Tax=Naganishia friedmannii TaxID=89922 RepID=A0ACC2VPQ9_9TREE|nr:hypothetical protein QFC21_003324 [Naganishia friedmannii]
MDFFSTDSDKFATSTAKTVTTTRTTVSVRREERLSQAKKPRRDDPPPQAHAQRINVLKRERKITPVQVRTASRTSTPTSAAKQTSANTPRKRQRRSPSASSSSSASSSPPEYENSRKRSKSPSHRSDEASPIHSSQQPLSDASPITRQVFRPSLIHSQASRDAPAADARWRGFIPSTCIVSDHLPKYRPYFPQEGFAIVDDRPPEVELCYPASGCSEKFPLIVPRTSNEYNPIEDLKSAIEAIILVYIPPAYAQLFGRDELVAHKRLLNSSSSVNSAPNSHPASPHGSASPFPSATGHFASSPAPGTPVGVTTPIPGSSATTTTGEIKPGESIWRALQRGYNRALGPLFVSAVEKFNATLVDIRPEIAAHLATAFPGPSADATGAAVPWVPGLNVQFWQILCELVAAQCYQRVVGPQIGSVHDYEPFSDNVYGELEPIYGTEVMPNPARLATLQIVEAKKRWAMWALRGTEECRAYQADFCKHEKTAKALRVADLVLVNNYAFTPALNDKLSLLFLDLKEGTKIISLKPFVSENFRLTERTATSPLAILKMKEKPYQGGCRRTIL